MHLHDSEGSERHGYPGSRQSGAIHGGWSRRGHRNRDLGLAPAIGAGAACRHDRQRRFARLVAGCRSVLCANYYPKEVAVEIDRVFAALDGAARIVVETVKYYLGKTDIQDDVIGEGTRTDMSRAADGDAYSPFPGLMTASMSTSSQVHLSEAVRDSLQQGLDLGYRPFLRMRHLYRAIQETVPRFKWIDATIAAELSVKEALLRAKPELKTLLVNLPSPPIGKLYGDVLETYLGERSPHRKALIEGAERRNKLIHRSEEEPVTLAQATEYVQTVMQAIHHLYSRLYPGWQGNDAMNLIQHYG